MLAGGLDGRVVPGGQPGSAGAFLSVLTEWILPSADLPTADARVASATDSCRRSDECQAGDGRACRPQAAQTLTGWQRSASLPARAAGFIGRPCFLRYPMPGKNRVDQTNRKRVILHASRLAVIGLRVQAGDLGWREEWPGEGGKAPGRGSGTERRSPQPSAGTQTGSRCSAGADKGQRPPSRIWRPTRWPGPRWLGRWASVQILTCVSQP